MTKAVYEQFVLDAMGGESMHYDPDSDSEYNVEIKKRVENALLHESVKHRACSIPRELAALIYRNPHNSNIIASRKSGNIKLFNDAWVVDEVGRLIDIWMVKFRETADTLEKREGKNLTESFEGKYVTELLQFIDENHLGQKIVSRDQKRRALICIENMNLEVKAVESVSGKKVKKVRGNERGLKDVVRKTTWEAFKAM